MTFGINYNFRSLAITYTGSSDDQNNIQIEADLGHYVIKKVAYFKIINFPSSIFPFSTVYNVTPEGIAKTPAEFGPTTAPVW